MVFTTSSTRTRTSFRTYTIIALAIILGGAIGSVLVSIAISLSILAKIGLFLLAPAAALAILSYIVSYFLEEAFWSLLLASQLIGFFAFIVLIGGMIG